jgi:Domain of unknown function (DUF3784)
MIFINLFTGLFLIIVGFLVKKFPDLIAGYNTLPAKEKEKVDITGLSTMMRNNLIIMGVAVGISTPIFTLLGLEQYGTLAILPIILIGTFFILIAGQGYKRVEKDRPPKKSIRTGLIITSFVVFVSLIAGFLYYGTRSPEFSILEKELKISGFYGMSVAMDSVSVVESIPKILQRTNGFAYYHTLKGKFNLEEYGPSILFLRSLTGPFILIRTRRGALIIINSESRDETESLFSRLKSALEE